MTYSEDDLLPLSALSHLVFCERRAALIHLEQLWEENRFTAEGRVLHNRTHEQQVEVRGDTRIVRSLRIRSMRLGLVGMADVVEFTRVPNSTPTMSQERDAVSLPGVNGLWRPMPVEYKRGRAKPTRCYEVQLCAQALCLEEMLGVTIRTGALFYGKRRRRTDVAFDELLRADTERATARLHELYDKQETPPAIYESKCRSCSLFELCKPKSMSSPTKTRRYVDTSLSELGLLRSSEPPPQGKGRGEQ